MPTLLAVDLGLRTGLALYRRDGRLAWYRSQHYGTRAMLRRGAGGLLDAGPDVAHVVLEGGGPLAEVWGREAARRGVPVRVIAAEGWRGRFFGPGEVRDREAAKRSADALARRVVTWSGAARPTSLRHDAAEAILIGLWGVLEVGWLGQVPDEVGPGRAR